MRYRFRDCSLNLHLTTKAETPTLAEVNRRNREFWKDQQDPRTFEPPRTLAEMNQRNRAFWAQKESQQ